MSNLHNYCALSKKHKCIKWTDYQVLLNELEEADELCHGNWIEIQHLREYIDVLKATLTAHVIEIPSEY